MSYTLPTAADSLRAERRIPSAPFTLPTDAELHTRPRVSGGAAEDSGASLIAIGGDGGFLKAYISRTRISAVFHRPLSLSAGTCGVIAVTVLWCNLGGTACISQM